jgi:hypothetical protein
MALNGQQYIETGSLDPQKTNYTTGGRYTRTNFRGLGHFTAGLLGYGNPAGATGDINQWNLPVDVGNQCWAEYFMMGAGQTILAPVYDVTTSAGVIVTLDATDNEGVEYLFGARDGSATTSLRGKHAYTIGTDKAFFVRLKLSIADVSGTDALYFGFRKTQAFQAPVTGYTDYATFAITASANPAVIATATRLNTGTAAIVDSTATWADAATKDLYIEVSQGGVSRFALNGALLGNQTSGLTGQAFTFDAGDTVVPFFSYLNSADVAGNIIFQEFECGYVEKRLY